MHVNSNNNVHVHINNNDNVSVNVSNSVNNNFLEDVTVKANAHVDVIHCVVIVDVNYNLDKC